MLPCHIHREREKEKTLHKWKSNIEIEFKLDGGKGCCFHLLSVNMVIHVPRIIVMYYIIYDVFNFFPIHKQGLAASMHWI